MNRIFAVALLLLLTGGAVMVQAEDHSVRNVAVVNVERVFREYYKSKIAEGAIKQQAELYRAHLLKLNDQMRQMEREFVVMRDNSQNLALADEARSKAEQSAAAKRRELEARRAESAAYARDRSSKLKEFELARRAEIISDIKREISRRAMAAKYDMVFDNSGKTTNDLPSLVYFRAGLDITNEIIRNLNATGTTQNNK